MKKCSNCASATDNNNETLCRYCGGKLVEIKLTRCPKCGTTVDLDDGFCLSCGMKINSAIAPPPDIYGKDLYLRNTSDTKRSSNKLLITLLSIAIVACIVAISSVCVILLSDNSDITEETANGVTSADTLCDYDPGNDDWYRLRKSKDDPSTQIGAYKTIKKALEDAERYRSQGYILYDKDFNVVE